MGLTQYLRKHLLYPLILRRAGDADQLRYLREYERSQFLSAGAIRELQGQRLSHLLRHAWDHCPGHRRRLEQAGLSPDRIRSFEDFEQVPVLEKKHIQEDRDSFVALNQPLGDRIENQTGGSTGTPISFFLNHDRRRSRAAATLRHNRWAGWELGDRVAYLWGAPRDMPGQWWRARLKQALLGQPLWLDASHVTEEKMLRFHEELHRYRPKVIQAYARALLLLARFMEQRGLEAYRPRSIVVSAEGLEPEERVLVERVFGCPIFNRYGCREVSVIASECEAHTGLHVMAEGLFVEVVRGQHAVRPGEMGSILVTDLLNRAMPLIRYRIGDMGSLASGTCACGRGLPRLQQVHGRMTDFLVGSDGRLVSGVHLATYVVAQRPSLGQVQMCQSRKGEILYRIRPGRDFRPEADRSYLTELSREYLGTDTQVRFEMVEELPREVSGKFLFSRSQAALEELGGRIDTASSKT